MRRTWTGSVRAVTMLALGLIALAVEARGADHLDSPRAMQFLALDIGDIYLFPSATRGNTVLVLTTSPSAGVVGPASFQPGALYQLKIDQNGDAFEDIVYTAGFSAPNANGVQSVVLLETRNGQPTVIASGTTGRDLKVRGGGTFRADIFDDPFFADTLAIGEFFRRIDRGLPNPLGPLLPVDPGTTDRPGSNPTIPVNRFGNFNALALVLDLPSSRLTQSRTNTQFGVWAVTSLDGVQYDRTGIPTVNTAIIPRLAVVPGVVLKDAFNAIAPSQDRFFFRQIAIDEVTRVFRGGNPAGVADLVDLLLPDILPCNPNTPPGFPNGRRLTDDVIDTELDLLTGGALTSDRIKNDSVFRSRFPYLGLPLPPPASR